MSRSTVLGLWPNTSIKAEYYEELSNSWQFAYVAWDALSNKHLGHKVNLSDMDDLWPLYKRGDIPLHHRVVLCATFDDAYILRKDFAKAAEHIREFLIDFPDLSKSSHWPRIAEILDSTPDCHAIGFWCTSVSDCPFRGEWDEAAENYSPFDWAKAVDVYELTAKEHLDD